MNSFQIGQFVGGVFAIILLSMILRLVLKRFLDGAALILVTVGSAVAIAIILNGFGAADGGPPKFGDGVVPYGFGGAVILILWLLANRGRRSSDGR